jgi:hypothetical protein
MQNLKLAAPYEYSVVKNCGCMKNYAKLEKKFFNPFSSKVSCNEMI